MKWNPLYPADDETNSLDESIREAEWEDSMRELEKNSNLDEEENF